MFDNAGIRRRFLSKPLDWYGESHTVSEKNTAYIDTATGLSTQAVTAILDIAGLQPSDIDYIIFINTTGLATPSIDARLIDTVGLRHDIRRTPIWGLGCAGGAAGLSHGYHYLLGHPTERVLLVGVELCSLTFIRDDFSKSNLVAAALFADGAAAVLLSGAQCDKQDGSTAMIDSHSMHYHDSLDIMGWNVVDTGLQVVFNRRIPDIVEEHSCADLQRFLDRHSMNFDDIDAWLFHPGGTKVIEAYERALGLNGDALQLSREILRDYGNMSSVTVLYVLERYLREKHRDEMALLSALGPGFSSESLLLRS